MSRGRGGEGAVIAFEAGMRLDNRYTLLRRLGQGSQAEVWEALWAEGGGKSKRVVLKVTPLHLHHSQDMVQMMIQEARQASRLRHPNIIEVFGCGEDENAVFMAMEYIEGWDLGTLLERCMEQHKHALPWPIAARIACMVCEGLEYAHTLCDEHGAPLKLVHRDIKPANILITTAGEIKLIDFGIAKSADSSVTQPGVIKGTPAYMAPEQVQSGALDARTDLFSLGCALYELCSGKRPFSTPTTGGNNVLSVLMWVLLEPPAPLDAKALNLPLSLVEVLFRLLEKEPNKRYESALALQQTLQSVMTQEGEWITQQQVGQFVANLVGAAAGGVRETIWTDVLVDAAEENEENAEKYTTAFYSVDMIMEAAGQKNQIQAVSKIEALDAFEDGLANAGPLHSISTFASPSPTPPTTTQASSTPSAPSSSTAEMYKSPPTTESSSRALASVAPVATHESPAPNFSMQAHTTAEKAPTLETEFRSTQEDIPPSSTLPMATQPLSSPFAMSLAHHANQTSSPQTSPTPVISMPRPLAPPSSPAPPTPAPFPHSLERELQPLAPTPRKPWWLMGIAAASLIFAVLGLLRARNAQRSIEQSSQQPLPPRQQLTSQLSGASSPSRDRLSPSRPHPQHRQHAKPHRTGSTAKNASARTHTIRHSPSRRVSVRSISGTRVASIARKRRAATASQDGYVLLDIKPPCEIFEAGTRLGIAKKLLLTRKPGVYKFRCIHFPGRLLRYFQATVRPTKITKIQRQFQNGTLFVLSFPWADIYLPPFGRLGRSQTQIPLPEGEYKLLLYQHGKENLRKTLSVRISPREVTRQLVRWEP